MHKALCAQRRLAQRASCALPEPPRCPPLQEAKRQKIVEEREQKEEAAAEAVRQRARKQKEAEKERKVQEKERAKRAKEAEEKEMGRAEVGPSCIECFGRSERLRNTNAGHHAQACVPWACAPFNLQTGACLRPSVLRGRGCASVGASCSPHFAHRV